MTATEPPAGLHRSAITGISRTPVGPLVYGTLSVLIVVAGLQVAGESTPFGSGAIILAGAVATWLAHTYADLMGQRADRSHSMSPRDVAHGLRHASPIILAAVPAALALGGAVQTWWTLEAAILATNLAGVAVLAVAGLAAAQARGSGPGGAILSTVATTSIGLGIILVEILLHH